MIYGLFHPGSGIGNQLHRYVATKVLALEKGYAHGMIGDFKGNHFINIGDSVNVKSEIEYPAGKVVVPEFTIWEEKIRFYNPEINFVKDNTILDGEFQDERYFERHLPMVDEWLSVEPIEMPDDLCVINFRGGEYVPVKDLFLPREYWNLAIKKMSEINPTMQFEVHTDDVRIAQSFFPDFHCIQNLEINWRSIRHAKYLILSNSSFAIIPALLGPAKKIIAPRYWAGYNVHSWKMNQNFYKRFDYIHHENL